MTLTDKINFSSRKSNMTTMGVTVFCNRVQLNGSDQEQLMLLRTLQDNESNIIGNQPHLIAPKNNNNNNGSANPASILPPYDPSRLKKHGKNGQPPPVAVARRNARERNRVKQVNNGFATLRQHIPSHIAAGYGDRGKKLSKVETLRMAVEYIRGLQRLLAEADGLEYEPNVGLGSQCMPSPTGSVVSSSHNGSGERLILEDDVLAADDDDGEQLEDDEDGIKVKTKIASRLSPNGTAMSSPHDYYASSVGDEENLEPRVLTTTQSFSRLSPHSVASPPSEYYGQNEENLEPQILSPYSGAGDSEEGAATVYAASPETFSGALYYKQEITEPGEFMDVVSWWEQEQGRLVHQQHTQRLTHV